MESDVCGVAILCVLCGVRSCFFDAKQVRSRCEAGFLYFLVKCANVGS